MSTNQPIRILTVDDHPLLREGIASLVGTQSDMTIIGEASGGREAVELFRKLRPDLTLMDLRMAGSGRFDSGSAGKSPGSEVPRL